MDISKRHRQDGNTFALAGKCIGCVDLVLCRLRSQKAISVWASDGVRRPLATFYPFRPFFMATGKKPSAPSSGKTPIYAVRMRGISAAVFVNETETADGRRLNRHDVSVQRRYRDGDEFKTTTVFRRDDLPILQLVTRRAWEYIVDMEAIRSKEEDEDE